MKSVHRGQSCQTHDGWEHGKQPAAAVMSHHHLMGDIVRSVFKATIIEK
jgi:hypothetical protein